MGKALKISFQVITDVLFQNSLKYYQSSRAFIETMINVNKTKKCWTQFLKVYLKENMASQFFMIVTV